MPSFKCAAPGSIHCCCCCCFHSSLQYLLPPTLVKLGQLAATVARNGCSSIGQTANTNCCFWPDPYLLIIYMPPTKTWSCAFPLPPNTPGGFNTWCVGCGGSALPARPHHPAPCGEPSCPVRSLLGGGASSFSDAACPQLHSTRTSATAPPCQPSLGLCSLAMPVPYSSKPYSSSCAQS